MIGGARGQVNESATWRLPKDLRTGIRSTVWSPLTKSPNLNDSACGTMFPKMPLSAGERIGPYEILAPLGAGGMGEVYRARDTKLGRDVALKVLREAFAQDTERMARFQREAQVLASLNHPNIASIYGLEDSGGLRALIMELVEGPTLAERIRDLVVGAGLAPPISMGTPRGAPTISPLQLDEAWLSP